MDMKFNMNYLKRINKEDKAMSLPLIKKITHTFFFFSLTAVTGISQADDTEIYFNSAATAATRPNVLLILDTSGSMTSNVTGTSQTRIEAMKEAMVDIITNTNDVNMGLMRFTYNDGGPVLHEIRDLDENASTPTISATIINGNDDAEEVTTGTGAGTVSLTDPILDVARADIFPASPTTIQIRVSDDFDDADERNGDVDNDTNDNVRLGHPSGGTRIDGLRFRGVEIPQNGNGTGNVVDVTSATLTLDRAGGAGSGTATADITVEAVDSSTAFGDNDWNLTTRTKSSAAPANIPATNWNVDTSNNPPTGGANGGDFEAHIDYLINRPGWSSGNSINVFLNSTNTTARSFESHETDSSKAALLNVTFTHNLAGGGEDNLTGLRFQNINIPQGATITSATLSFKSNNSVNDGGTAEVWTVTAENDTSGDTVAFTSTASSISARKANETTASVNWTPGDTTTDDTITSPDLSAVIQEVVKDNANWCGGNAITLFVAHNAGDQARQIYSYESAGKTPPVLDITYDPATATGCYQATETAQIKQSADDTEGSDTGGGTLNFQSGNNIGLRFQDINVPQGANIIDAKLIFNARDNDTGTTTINIWGEASDDASSYGNVNTRTKGSKSVTWTPANWTQSQTYETSTTETSPAVGLKEIVKEIVDRTGWSSGNDMAFILETTTSTDRRARTYNNDPQRAPRLEITYESTGAVSGGGAVTVRDNLIDIVNALPSNDWTPITEVFYESAHYWRGESVEYGKSRDGRSDTRLSSSATYTGGTVNYPTGCTEDNLDAYACRNQSITGSPVYKTPFTGSLACQSNYQVLLTDGEANSNDIASTINSEFSLGGCQTTKSDGSGVTGGESCSIDLVKYMLENDQSSTIPGDQTVKTYTVGFDTAGLANATQFLKDVAAAGGGEFFQADNKQGLIDKFNEILSAVKSETTSFAAPSIAVNTFNRLFSRDEIYFGLFAPDLETRWDGNLKKYNICVDPNGPDGVPGGGDDCTLGDVLDANNLPAVVDNDAASDNGLFFDSRQPNSSTGIAQSEWSSAPDGREIREGGAGDEIGTNSVLKYTDRIIFTDVNNSGTAANSASLDATGFKITATNWTGADTDMGAVRNAVCGSAAANPSAACVSTMEYMLGKDIFDEDEDTATNTRWWFSDILHSSPNVITYGQDGSNNFIDKVLVGTNSGSLHMINGSDGIEDWSFIPNDMLQIQQTLYDNVATTHTYGIDTTPILRIVDNNIDGTIDPAASDLVHVYFGQRRGGSHYYALDITPSAVMGSVTSKVNPKFLWRIDPKDNSGTEDCDVTGCAKGDFSRLGQTWSEPVIAKIKALDSSGVAIPGGKTVLIFGGGYDAGLDSLDSSDTNPISRNFSGDAGTPNIGNGIYVVDATTGDMVFWVSHAADSGAGIATSGAHIQVPEMYDSIPSDVTVLDTDGDGFDDRLYVGDTGGNIWRLDLAADIKPSDTSAPQGSSVVGKLASLSTAGTIKDERRIFYAPSVSQVRDTEFSNAAGGEFDYVIVTTGNRSNPLNADTANVDDVSDGLFALRDSLIGPMTNDGTNNASDYPRSIAFNSTTGQSAILTNEITPSDMTKISLTTGLGVSDAEKDSLGWYLLFDDTGTHGEKGLAAVRVFFGAVFLTTYVPDNASSVLDPCQAAVGTGRIFNFNILNGRPALFWDGGDDSSYTSADIVQTLGAGGIAPEVVPVYTPDGVTILAGKENIGLAGENETIKTYWYQE
jgi:type IV pilus assembly protein PilY1